MGTVGEIKQWLSACKVYASGQYVYKNEDYKESEGGFHGNFLLPNISCNIQNF